MGEAAQSYFSQSEQIPSIVRLAVRKDEQGWVAGGLMFQHLPEGEEGRDRLHTRLDHPEWPHVAVLVGSVKPEELLDRELPLDDLIWRLLHEEDEVRTLAPVARPVIVTTGATESSTVSSTGVACVTWPFESTADASMRTIDPGGASAGMKKTNDSVWSAADGAIVRVAASCGLPVWAR